MGFDAAHTISALSKLALRLMRNANKKEASQQMDMYFSAKRQTLAQFMEVYDQQRLHEIHGGSTIIFDAMAHQSPQDRYDIVRFLIAQGAELTGTNGENETLFHILFSRPKHNMAQTVELTKLLIDAGADINQPDAKGRVALQHLISHPRLTDRDLAPLYDLLFTRCRLDLSIKNAWGYTPIELAQKLPSLKFFKKFQFPS